MLKVVGFEEFALANLVALQLERIYALLSQVLSVRIGHLLSILKRLLLTEGLALELGFHGEACKPLAKGLVSHCLQ